uniref:Uncharacterized protein n=1 Tax=Aegilops tauschii subsp. strangulata TaxID=200361 RepID=A0A453GQK0_AEGTS
DPRGAGVPASHFLPSSLRWRRRWRWLPDATAAQPVPALLPLLLLQPATPAQEPGAGRLVVRRGAAAAARALRAPAVVRRTTVRMRGRSAELTRSVDPFNWLAGWLHLRCSNFRFYLFIRRCNFLYFFAPPSSLLL